MVVTTMTPSEPAAACRPAAPPGQAAPSPCRPLFLCIPGLPRSLTNPEVIPRLGRAPEWTPPEHMRWQFQRLEALRGASPS